MPNMSGKRVMSGTFGEVWVDGELFAEISAFQAKYTYSKEDMYFSGQMAVDTKITNVKGTGSMTLKKVYSRFAGHADNILKGVDTRMTLIGKLDDPDAFGAERVALYNVSLDEETIMDWKVGSTTETTVPFTFTEREWLEAGSPA